MAHRILIRIMYLFHFKYLVGCGDLLSCVLAKKNEVLHADDRLFMLMHKIILSHAFTPGAI